MPRTRYLKPDFFDDAELCELKPLARLLFAGLWCWADREGRLLDEPVRLKKNILGYDKCDINALLDSLEGCRKILRYTVDGRRYILITTFLRHQHPHTKELPSTYPPPCQDGLSTDLGRVPSTFKEVPSPASRVRNSDLDGEQEQEPERQPVPDPRDAALTRMTVAYDGLMGRLASTIPIQQEMADWLEDAPQGYDAPSLFEDACREAALNDGKSLKYVLAILKRWQRDGREDRRPKPGGQGRPAAVTGNGAVNTGAGLMVKTFEQELADQKRAKESAKENSGVL